MNLRNLLRRATELRVAHPKERNTQLSGVDCATCGATAMQQHPTNPHECYVSSATDGATAMQQGIETRATLPTQNEKLRVAFTSTRNTQHGALTGHRIKADLIRAAMKVCDQFNDNEAARADMRRQCLELPPHLQADLLDHFNGKPAQFN
jgi:hypothetical protein